MEHDGKGGMEFLTLYEDSPMTSGEIQENPNQSGILPSHGRTLPLKFQGVCFICNAIAKSWSFYEGCGRIRGSKY